MPIAVSHPYIGRGYREDMEAPHVVTGSGGSPWAFVVAAVDSPAGVIAGADFVCDGVADEVELIASLAALPARGGTIIWAAGTYQLASNGPALTVNKRILVLAHGAVFKLAAGVTGLTVNQGNIAARGMRIEGLFIDGQNNASTIGVSLKDTNNPELVGLDIENCTTGIDMVCSAVNGFVEGALIENVMQRECTVGIDMRVVAGTGSFAQTVIRGLKCTVGPNGFGLRLQNPGILQRSFVQATFWVDDTETAVSLDGNIEDTTLNCGVEGFGGSTTNVGLLIGVNVTNSDQAFISLLFTGSVGTQVNNVGNKNFHYWSGGSQIVQSTGNAVLGYKRHGDATDRLRFEGLTNGGRIQFGTGAALDTALFRVAAAILGITSTLEFTELGADPAAGAANTARLFSKDNGAGKTQLVVRFPTGATQVIATEP